MKQHNGISDRQYRRHRRLTSTPTAWYTRILSLFPRGFVSWVGQIKQKRDWAGSGTSTSRKHEDQCICEKSGSLAGNIPSKRLKDVSPRLL